MQTQHGVLDEPKTIVFKGNFKVLDRVVHIPSGIMGTISRVWGKELITKFDDCVVVKCFFEYTLAPEKPSYNKIRCKESDLSKIDSNGIAF